MHNVAIIVTTLSIFLLFGCKDTKPETSADSESDTIVTDSPVSATTEDDPDEENINDEDHGDPGVSSMIISESELDPEIVAVVSALKKKQLQNLVAPGKEFIITRPGPGVYPVVSYGTGSEDLMALSDFALLLSDTSKLNLTFYKF
jgi:hypothetical protein